MHETVTGMTKPVRPKSVLKVFETQINSGFLETNRQDVHLGLRLSKGIGD